MANKVIGHIPYGLGLRLVNPSEKESAKVVVATAQQLEVIDLPLLAKHVNFLSAFPWTSDARGLFFLLTRCYEYFCRLGAKKVGS